MNKTRKRQYLTITILLLLLTILSVMDALIFRILLLSHSIYYIILWGGLTILGFWNVKKENKKTLLQKLKEEENIIKIQDITKNQLQVCGNCQHRYTDGYDEFVCINRKSEYITQYVDLEDTCDEWAGYTYE